MTTPPMSNDPVEDVVAWHTYHRVKGRCHCGTSIQTDVAHRRHLVEMARDEVIPRLEADAYNRGYEQGYEDGRHA